MPTQISTLADDEARHAAIMTALQGAVAPASAPQPDPGGKRLVLHDSRAALNKTQLWWKKSGQYCWSCFHELRFDLTLEAPSYVRIYGPVNLTHRGNATGAVGWGVKATVRSAPSFSAMPAIPVSSVDLPYWQSVETTGVIPGSKVAGNILGIEDHYANPTLSYSLELPAGCHRIEHWGNSHRSGAPEDNAYVELNQNAVPDAADPYTMLFLEVMS